VGHFTFKSDFPTETITNKLPESLDVSKLNMESMWLILLWKKCARTFVKPPTLSLASWWIEPRWWKTKWCLCIICQCQEEILWVCLCIRPGHIYIYRARAKGIGSSVWHSQI